MKKGSLLTRLMQGLKVGAPDARRNRGAMASTSGTGVSTPPPDMVNGGNGNYYEALRDSKDRSGIPQAMVHLRPQFTRLLQGLNRKLLAAVGRYLVDNGGVPFFAVSQIANYSVPVFPQAQTGDSGANKDLEDYFSAWEKRADFTGRFTFGELQRIACMQIDTDGDVGVNADDSIGFPQIRLFDTFHIGSLLGLDQKDGVLTDDKGRLLGYKIIDGPADTLRGIASKTLTPDQLLLLRDADRYSNYRGFSPLRMGANDIRDVNDIKSFLKLKEKLAAALGGVIQQNGMIEENLWGDDEGNAPDASASKSDKKLSLAELLGGDIVTIDGQLQLVESKSSSGTQSMEFLNWLIGQFVFGLGIPPAFFLDEKLTGPNIRSVIGKVQRKFDNRKAQISKMVEFSWVRVIADGINKRDLKPVPNWWKIGYQYQPLMTIDIGDTVANDREDVLVGQMSRRERYGNRGKDWQREEDQITLEDNYILEQLKKQADQFKIPIELLLNRRGFGLVKPPQQQPKDPQGSTGNGK